MNNTTTVNANPIKSNTQSVILGAKAKGVAVNNCGNIVDNNEKCITFVVHYTNESSRTKDNTPSLPLNDAHLEGFFMPNPQP